MKFRLLAFAAALLVPTVLLCGQTPPNHAALIARARALELDTPYVPPDSRR